MKLSIETDQKIKSISLQVEFYESGEVADIRTSSDSKLEDRTQSSEIKNFSQVKREEKKVKSVPVSTDHEERSANIDPGISSVTI